MISIQTNAAEFNRTLAEYVALRKRDMQTEIYRKADDVALRLGGYRGGKQVESVRITQAKVDFLQRGIVSGGFGPPIQADPAKIERDAKARNFAFGRDRKNTFTPRSKLGVSEAAEKLAREMMEGQNVQAFKENAYGLVPLKFGKGGISKNRVLMAGNSGGNKSWRRRGKSLHQLSDSDLEDAAQKNAGYKDYKLLNVKAIANHIELKFRKRAAAGGLLRVQWLPKSWIKGLKRIRQMGMVYVNRSNTNKVMGKIAYENNSVTITSNVPGTAKFQGVIAGVLSDAAADMREYIRTKMLGQFKATVLKQPT